MGSDHVNFSNTLPAVGVLGYLTVPADEGKHTIIHNKMVLNGVVVAPPGVNESLIYAYEDVAAGQINLYCEVPTGPASLLSAVKAWCTFAGTGASPIAVTSGYNVTNVTWAFASLYRINFTTPLANANYAVLITAEGPAFYVGTISAKTVNDCTINTKVSPGSTVLPPFISVLVIGN